MNAHNTDTKGAIPTSVSLRNFGQDSNKPQQQQLRGSPEELALKKIQQQQQQMQM